MMLSVIVGACCSIVLWCLDIHLSLLFGSIHFVLNVRPPPSTLAPAFDVKVANRTTEQPYN